MRYEFSWKNEAGKFESFRTSCPKMAELMMRSQTDFPRRTISIQKQFDDVYGVEQGKFERLLIDLEYIPGIKEVNLSIRGLIVRLYADSGTINLTDRPFNYC